MTPDPGADPVSGGGASSASILVHFGIIMVVNMEIGMLTPPVGLNTLSWRSGISSLGLTRHGARRRVHALADHASCSY